MTTRDDTTADLRQRIADALQQVPDARPMTAGITDAVMAVLEDEAAERWIEQQIQQTGIRAMDFRNGMHMDIAMARDIAAGYVAAARSLLGDAPNYSETKLEFDVKVAESPEMYTLVVQRHAPGALTPHEARQRAEARVAELETELAQLRTERGQQ